MRANQPDGRQRDWKSVLTTFISPQLVSLLISYESCTAPASRATRLNGVESGRMLNPTNGLNVKEVRGRKRTCIVYVELFRSSSPWTVHHFGSTSSVSSELSPEFSSFDQLCRYPVEDGQALERDYQVGLAWRSGSSHVIGWTQPGVKVRRFLAVSSRLRRRQTTHSVHHLHLRRVAAHEHKACRQARPASAPASLRLYAARITFPASTSTLNSSHLHLASSLLTGPPDL